MAQRASPRFRIWQTVALAVLMILSLHFVLRSVGFGVQGLWGKVAGETYLYAPAARASNTGVFIHMMTGGVLTFLAPVQLYLGLRQRWPGLHRATGYLLTGMALLTGVGGLVYILLRGTIGGWVMDVGFGLYGLLLILCAVQTVRYARGGRLQTHQRWALRLFALAMGSWLYRVHYTLWYILTGGLGSSTDFTGPFDLIQMFGFYLPYLVTLEIWFAARARPAAEGR